MNSLKTRSVFSYFHDRKFNCKIFGTSNQLNDRLNQLGFKNFCFLIFLWEKLLRLEKHKCCVDSLLILNCKHFFCLDCLQRTSETVFNAQPLDMVHSIVSCCRYSLKQISSFAKNTKIWMYWERNLFYEYNI